MTSKTINTPKLLVLFIAILFTLVPAVTATPEHAVYSAKDVNKPTDKTSYSIVPAAEESSPNTGNPRVSSQTVGTAYKGKSYNSYINIGPVNWLEVDLKWGVASNSLSLTIYNPSGSNLGTYYDSSDGKIDGRIHIAIYPSSRYLDQGRWTFTTKGVTVSGTKGQSYTLYFYTH
jgi:hypothetical protein